MRAIFLDRDGVINVERGDYTYKIKDFVVMPKIIETLAWFKNNKYALIVATNQAGISKNIYSREQMNACHEFFQKQSDFLIDTFYYSPWHPTVTNSLCRKPDSLMFEKAIYKYNLDPNLCWMVGDKERDLVPARKLGIRTILIDGESEYADYVVKNVEEIKKIIPV